MNFPVNVMNEGHASDGVLICKISIDSIEEAERIFEWVERKDITYDAGVFPVPDYGAPYVAVQGWDFFPAGVNKPPCSYAAWLSRDTDSDACDEWGQARQIFDPRWAVMYFEVSFNEEQIAEDEQAEDSEPTSASLAEWRALVEKARTERGWERDPKAGAALSAEDTAVRFVSRELTKLFQPKED